MPSFFNPTTEFALEDIAIISFHSSTSGYSSFAILFINTVPSSHTIKHSSPTKDMRRATSSIEDAHPCKGLTRSMIPITSIQSLFIVPFSFYSHSIESITCKSKGYFYGACFRTRHSYSLPHLHSRFQRKGDSRFIALILYASFAPEGRRAPAS